MSENNSNSKYQAAAILVVPIRLRDGYDLHQSKQYKEIPSTEQEKVKNTISKLALFNHAGILLGDASTSGNDENIGINIYDLSEKVKNAFGVKDVDYIDGFNEISFHVEYTDREKEEKLSTRAFHFSWKKFKDEDSEYSNEWKTPKLIEFPLSNICFITFPVETESCSNIDEIYTLFNKLSVTIGYDNMKLFSDYSGDRMSMKEIVESIVPELMKGKASLMAIKSMVSFVYASNPDLNLEKKDTNAKPDIQEIRNNTCKLAYTSDLKGFVADDKIPFLQMLDSDPKQYASASIVGASFVSVGKYKSSKAQGKLNTNFWLFLLLLIQRYSLLDILFDLNSINTQNNVNLKELNANYRKMCKIKASLFFTDISDRYDISRIYHMFGDGLKIEALYDEVNKKLDLLNQYLANIKDEQNKKFQKFISLLLVILTLTSGLNDLLDIVNDAAKWIPAIIAFILVGFVFFKNRDHF